MSVKNDVELIVIGNELLRGDRKDSHVGFFGRHLFGIGVRLDQVYIVADDRAHIAELVAGRLGKTKVLVVTGGLGPTHDDVTREGVADGLGVDLEFVEEQWKAIQEMFARYGWKLSESNRRQAYFPRGAKPLANARGTAPGFTATCGDCIVMVLPGPPREFRAMLDTHVLPEIDRRFKRSRGAMETFRTAGIGESKLTPIIESLLERYKGLTVASLPHVAGVDILVRCKRDAGGAAEMLKAMDGFGRDLHQMIGKHIYAEGDSSFEYVIGEMLVDRGETLAIAESLTGGLMGKRLTDVSGSSRFLLADVVAYSNESKMKFLGVKEETLIAHGAVSREVCREMAEGIRVATGATYGLATTGIAGPTGGTDEKPVGLCYFGSSWEGGADIQRRVFPGERNAVRERVVWASLYCLYEKLRGPLPPGFEKL